MLDQVAKIITSKIDKGLEGIYLFGSTRDGTSNGASDLDLAILLNIPIDPYQLWRIGQDIAIKINRDVDLVNLSEASTVFQFEVITKGRRIATLNEKNCEAFEDKVFQLYLTLNEDRRYILEDIKKTGKVYE